MLEGVSETPFSWDLRRFAALDSTNAEIKRLIAAADIASAGGSGDLGAASQVLDARAGEAVVAAPEGCVVVADIQEGGYGRQGRLWASPPGGLYCSLLLRPQDYGVDAATLPTLSLVIALAVCRTLEAMGSQEYLKVKWPNDVFCSAGKLCGISLEAVSGAVCVGIGINIFEPFEKVTLAGAYNAAYAVQVTQSDRLAHKVGSEDLASSQNLFKEEVLSTLLAQIGQCYSRWLGQGFSVFRQEFQNRSSLQGSAISLVTQNNDVIVQGEVIGLDERGRLLLRTQAGEVVAAESGEAHIERQ